MKKWIFSLLLLCSSHFAYALLSPLSQSIKEINTIITRPELRSYLKESEQIEDIRRLQDSYVIVTNHSRMVVDVTYLPSKGVGPQEFEIKFNKPIPLNRNRN